MGGGRPRLEPREPLASYDFLSHGGEIQVVEDESLERQRKALVDRRIVFENDDESLERQRKALVDRRVGFEKDGWQQKKKDSEAKTWCEPVTRETQLETIQSFYQAMHDDDTMELEHCVLCGLQKSAVDMQHQSWSTFYSLYEQVRDYLQPAEQEHFSCRRCFPRSGADLAICEDCEQALQQRKVPRACQVNMLLLRCEHRYPAELRNLSPVEERLIGLYQACGWITKFQIDVEKGTSGRYRKLKKGHVTVFPNDVEGLACNVLPHPLTSELERIHVCFVAPRKPVPKDTEFVLAVNPEKLKRALVWLKANNPLYQNVKINEDHLQSWSLSCPDTEVPQALFDSMVPYDQSAEDVIRTGHYVSNTERGGVEQPVLSAEEVLASLEDRQNDTVEMEVEGNARLGSIRTRHLEGDELAAQAVELELEELTSTGLMNTEMEGEYSPQERLRQMRRALATDGVVDRQQRVDFKSTNTLITDGHNPVIANKRGEELVNSNDPDFFPKTFPCLFPWGSGGPKNVLEQIEGDAGLGENDESNAKHGSGHQNFQLRSWVRLVLQRHGGRFATHPSFPFLAFNMLLRSENRRISNMRMTKASFVKVKEICTEITPADLQAASDEYRETGITKNDKVAYVLRELSSFGYRQHMSNEQRLYMRRQINALSLRHGMPSIWFTINPNDLTNEVNMKMTAYRATSGLEAENLIKEFRQYIGRVQHIVRDPVSSAKFFHREIILFFDKYVNVNKKSVFGKVSGYFACVETNERGALHLHGLLWLDANLDLPTLLDDVAKEGNEGYADRVVRYIDSVFSESCNEQEAKTYKRWESVFASIADLVEDPNELDEVFDKEANRVACRCNLHSCGPTCVKYSFKNDRNKAKKDLCRFKAPWKLYEKTEFTDDGLFRVRRNHPRVNRYNPALSVGLRHNTDVSFLPTSSSGLAMVYYSTNYSTKLDTPLWKRAALMGAVLEGLRTEKYVEEQVDQTEAGAEKVARKNDKTRQFLNRTANQVFTSRELSSVEVCSNLLGYANSFSSQKTWRNVHLNTLYWVIFRKWKGIQDAAGPLSRQQEAPETVSLSLSGISVTPYEAYAHRGPHLRDLCLYEYLSVVYWHRMSKNSNTAKAKYFPFDKQLEGGERWIQELRETDQGAVPTVSGYLVDNVDNDETRQYCWAAVTLLGLFVPWEDFLGIGDLQGDRHQDTSLPTVNSIWLQQLETLPQRIKGIYCNIKLLRKSAEDAKKDAQLWANRGEGDHGEEFEEVEEHLPIGTTWRPEQTHTRLSFHEILSNMHDRDPMTQGSMQLKTLLEKLEKADFANPTASSDQEHGHRVWQQNELRLPKSSLAMIKASQLRMHKQRILAMEGDDEAEVEAGNGFGDGGDENWPALAHTVRQSARTWLDIASDQSFVQVGREIANDMTLNKLQWVALALVCEAMDKVENGNSEEDGPPPQQHLQYVGGSGGTGKSWFIHAIERVFTIKNVRKEMVITAMSGTAAAGIDGNTVHSALGLTFKDREGQGQENMPTFSMERSKQRWRRRKVLIIDEVSMLGLQTLFDVDRKLKLLRGFEDRDFGGMPIVIFTGDFLQFGPVQQKSLLSEVGHMTEGQSQRVPTDKRVMKQWQQVQAKRLWEKFDKVILLEEQKRAQGDPYLLGLLERIRNGEQTQQDMDELNKCYVPQQTLDFSDGRRAITPLNKHRWSLTLHATIEYGRIEGKKVSLFISDHQWKTRAPSADEMEAVMQLGDDGELPIPGIFPYVEGMPVIVNENKYLGLKVANGAEFTAVGIVPDPNVQEHVVDEGLSIFFGSPAGILLQSKALKDVQIVNLPANTIMLGVEWQALNGQKHGPHVCPTQYKNKGFRMGISRRGLPCVPGFALTDYKSQSRTMEKVLLGLYGRKTTRGRDGGIEEEKCEILSLYVQLSRCKQMANIRLLRPLRAKDFLESKMHPELIAGNKKLKSMSTKTVEAFETRHGNI